MIYDSSNVGIIIQARMGSTRLPAKIMMPINGVPVLEYQIERLKSLPYPIYIATTDGQQDDTIQDFALAHNLICFRGSELNVLKRYYDCALHYQVKVIVRITSDCPFIDADLINEGVKEFLVAGNERLFLSNTIKRTFPRGADFEIFSFTELENSYNNATENGDKEHVTPYIWKNRSGMIELKYFTQDKDYSAYRLTLDTPEDFELINILINKYKAHTLSIAAICDIMDQNPELTLINNHIEQKKT